MIIEREQFTNLYQYNYNIQEEVFSIYKPFLEKIGITFFAHTNVSYELKVSGVVSDTDFAIFWCENDYLFPILSPPGFLLARDLQGLFPKEKEDKLLERFGIAHTLFYIKKNKDDVDVFVIGGDIDNKSVISNYINHAQYIEKFILHFAEVTSALMFKAKNHAFKYGLQAFPNMELNLQLAMQFPNLVNDIIIPEDFSVEKKQLLSLSPREIQCLMSASELNTAKETAKKLGLSYRTVEAYFESIKTKLNCTSKRETVEFFTHHVNS